MAVTLIIVPLLPLNILTLKDGRHTGYITAVEDNVTPIIPNNTTSVYVKTELQSSQEDVYCVKDSDVDLINKLKDAAASKKNVTISYNAYMLTGLGNCSGDTIILVE